MKDDTTRRMIYRTIVVFLLFLVFWISFVYVNACGLTLTCVQASPLVVRTPIPTLIPAKPLVFRQPVLPLTVTPDASMQADIARPSNPGSPGEAVTLTGKVDSGKQIYVDNCQRCHGPDGKNGNLNPGTVDGTVPALNPIDPTLASADYQIFATNIDLFIEHGSTPAGTTPNLFMPAWGDRAALNSSTDCRCDCIHHQPEQIII